MTKITFYKGQFLPSHKGFVVDDYVWDSENPCEGKLQVFTRGIIAVRLGEGLRNLRYGWRIKTIMNGAKILYMRK